MRNPTGLSLLILFGFLLISFGVFSIAEVVNSNWRQEAVKHHGAEYYLDQNHERQWRWLDEKPSIEVRPE